MSVVSAARWSAPLLTAFAHSRSRAPRPEAASNSASATMPVNGVRMSCAMPASATSTAPCGGPAARLRVPRRRPRFFALRLAMPPALAPTMPDSAEPGQTADIGGLYALRAQLAQTRRLRRFRQFVAILAEDQPVMVITRRGQAQ